MNGVPSAWPKWHRFLSSSNSSISSGTLTVCHVSLLLGRFFHVFISSGGGAVRGLECSESLCVAHLSNKFNLVENVAHHFGSLNTSNNMSFALLLQVGV